MRGYVSHCVLPLLQHIVCGQGVALALVTPAELVVSESILWVWVDGVFHNDSNTHDSIRPLVQV